MTEYTKTIKAEDLSDDPTLKDVTLSQWMIDTAREFCAEYNLDSTKYKVLFSFEENVVRIQAEEVS